MRPANSFPMGSGPAWVKGEYVPPEPEPAGPRYPEPRDGLPLGSHPFEFEAV